MNGIKAILFDFDGLLMDTESIMLQTWQYEWQQWGLVLDLDGFFVDHGGDVTEQRYDALARAVGDGYDRNLSHMRRIHYRDQLHADLDLSPGMRAWIEEAEALDLSLAIASSSPLAWLHSHLGRAGVIDRFQVLAGGDEVEHHKPAPDVYRLALDRLGVDSTSALAFEDSPHGILAAQAAGLRCVAIPNPHVSAERVAHAELVLTSASAAPLAEVIRRLCA